MSPAAQSSQPSVNSDWLGQWQWTIFDPLQNRHPLTDRQQIRHRRFVTDGYVDSPSDCAIFGSNLPMGGFWANRGSITIFFCNLYLFGERTYRSDGWTDFQARWLKRRGLTQGWWPGTYIGLSCNEIYFLVCNFAKYLPIIIFFYQQTQQHIFW